MPLRLNENEREALKRLARKARDVRALKRAQALLDLDAGDKPHLVARRYQVTRSTIYNWIKRYRTRGLSDTALRDLPRSGRPRSPRSSAVNDAGMHGEFPALCSSRCSSRPGFKR